MRRIALILFLTLGLACTYIYKIAVLDFELPYDFGASKIMTIPYGASLKTVADILDEQGIINHKEIFYWSLRVRYLLGLNQGFVHAGEYQFPAVRSHQSIAEKMLKGDVILYRITIPEGFTSQDILGLLGEEVRLSGPLPPAIQEGSLLAETYTFAKGTPKTNIIEQAQKALQVVLDDLWRQRPPDYPLRTQHEALILASIVEKETAIAQERPLIAGVFLNRLHKGMRLQTDPTVIYAHELITNKPFQGPLLRRHLKIDSLYNTYLHPGLTPGPICHVGIGALKAVFTPAVTDALYFVADGTGGHVFSKTYKKHQENHEKWRIIRKKMN